MLLTRRSVALGLAALAAARPGLAGAGDRPVLLVFTSAHDDRAQRVVQTFSASVDFAVQMSYDLGESSDAAWFVSDRIRGFRASLVFAVGDRALQAAAREFLLMPVIFANATETRLSLGRRDIIGIAPWPDPATSVVRLRQAVPTLRRLGVIRFASDGGRYWQSLRVACDAVGVALETVTVAGRDDVPGAARYLMRSTDIAWLHDAPGMWTGALVAEVLHEAWNERFPMVGFATDQLRGPQPASLVLVSDPEAVGQAAADVARQIVLQKMVPADLVLPRVESQLHGSRSALRNARIPVTRRTIGAYDGWGGSADLPR